MQSSLLRSFKRALPRSPLLHLWSASDLRAFIGGLGVQSAWDIVSTVELQEIDGPQALTALAQSKQSLFQLLQLKSSQLAEGDKIASALQKKLQECNQLDEAFQRQWSTLTAMQNRPLDLERLADKMKGCLWGMYIGDALSMPVHWSYDIEQMRRNYGQIKEYIPAPDTVDNTIMYNHWKANKSHSQDVIGKVINHQKAHLWEKPYTHYHAGMAAGEGTLDLRLARVLARSIIKEKDYNRLSFLEDFKQFMTTPGSHNDVYADAFLRQFFYNHVVLGKDLQESVGEMNHDTPATAGIVSVPLVALVSLDKPLATVNSVVRKHVLSTHLSDRLARFGTLYSSLLTSLILNDNKQVAEQALLLAGEELGIDLKGLVSNRLEDTTVLGRLFSIACYIGDAFPSLVYLVYKYVSKSPDNFEGLFEEAVLANTNCGGENCHRGACVGALVGSIVGASKIPPHLIDGLHSKEAIAQEINDFVDLAVSKVKAGQ